MTTEKTNIPGLIILEPTVFKDSRGYFMESFNEKTLQSLGIDEHWVQDNQSCSQKGVVRGLHFQKPPYAQAKLVRILKGAAIDIAVDIRQGSSTYGQYQSVLLTEENFRQFYMPIGFAHGFVALTDDTVFFYKCSNFYNKESEGSIRFDDPDLHIDWPVLQPILSDKDRKGTLWRDFVSPFYY